MTATQLEQHFRWFLLTLASLLCGGTLVELALQGHTQTLEQGVPFGLCTAGLVTSLLALWRPTRLTLWLLRGVMLAVGLGSGLGVYFHLTSNLEIVRETQAALVGWSAWWKAAQGAAPLLAPGILAFAASVAWAATYYHPALGAHGPLKK